MTKLTLEQLFKAISEHNEKHNVTQQFKDEHALTCVIVFSQSNWPEKTFSEESRSYAFRSDNKYFIPEMRGNSIFAESLDKSDKGIRLDWYLREWKHIEYCYIKED